MTNRKGNFFIFAILCQLLASVTGGTHPLRQQRHHHVVKRLVGGTLHNATQSEVYDYVVSIRSRTPKMYFGDNHYCVGGIIEPNIILTAAHCAMDKTKVNHRPRALLIVAGTPNRIKLLATSIQTPVSAVYAPRNFTLYHTNDVAIFRLKDSYPADAPGVRILTLPSERPSPGTKCRLAGWGRLFRGGPLAGIGSTVELEVWDNEECGKLVKNLMPEMLCASNRKLSSAAASASSSNTTRNSRSRYNDDPDDPEVEPAPAPESETETETIETETNGTAGYVETEGACGGDIGAPLICDGGVIAGVVSYSIGCGKAELPTVFTSVYEHVDWIKESINGAMQLRTDLRLLFLCGIMFYGLLF